MKGMGGRTSYSRRILFVALGLSGAAFAVQDNPYRAVPDWAQLPSGRTWGATSAVDIDPDGRSVWVAERCGANSCVSSDLPAVVKFDPSGKAVHSFGGGMFAFPHGFHVDGEGNVWVVDGIPLGSGTPPAGKGHTVVKFSPEGKVLMTLGTPGVAGNPPENLNEPCDVITMPNGDILVSEGHSGQSNKPAPTTVSRISQFSKDGKFIKSWGRLGSGPGEFKTPHALAFDAQGRLYVADRGNNRVQIFDQEFKFVAEWPQFGRPSDVHVDANGVLYVADAESSRRYGTEWKRGIRIGRVTDGVVQYQIPPHKTDNPEGMSGEAVAVDAQGNVYSAEVGTDGGAQAVRGLTKYVRRAP
jgi:sugar lactone lactonase YvrE